MITPERLQTVSTIDEEKALIVEQAVDSVIMEAHRSGHWPAYPAVLVSMVNQATVDFVMTKYFDAGWDVRNNDLTYFIVKGPR